MVHKIVERPRGFEPRPTAWKAVSSPRRMAAYVYLRIRLKLMPHNTT